jgi:hypothetical protein
VLLPRQRFKLARGANDKERAAEEIENGVISLFVVGFIRYADLNEIERFMGFCREYIFPRGDNGDGRFAAVHDHDYEYQD